MKMQNLSFVLALLLFFANQGFSQTDDINISAAFSSSVSLVVTGGDNISFNVTTLDDYVNGIGDPNDYISTFEVNSSVNYKVNLAATDFTSSSGAVLDADNFGYYIESVGTHQTGRNLKIVNKGTNPSQVQLLGSDQEIIRSHAQGNAGDASANSFEIRFELGTAEVRSKSGLPTLLDQNIAPGNYSSTITLTATAVP